MKKIIIGIIFIVIYQQAASQDVETKISSIRPLYHPIDTVRAKDDRNSLDIKISWMNSEIIVRKKIRIKYDLETARSFKRDSTYVPSPIDTLRANEVSKMFSQNCHSYALEILFETVKIDNTIFNNWTVLTENFYMDRILTATFVKIRAFEIKRKKCKECTFNKNSLIVFRNKTNLLIHTVFYDGEYFYSKYGGGSWTKEKTIEKNMLKVYWDTAIIEEYRLDNNKINDFVGRQSEN